MNPEHTTNTVRERLASNLASTEFFHGFSHAFVQLTSLHISLEATREGEELTGVQTHFNLSGVADTRVPVRVGKNLVAVIHTGGVRLAPATADSFAPVATALLDSGRTAGEIKAEQAAFAQLPVMAEEKYQAALAFLTSFAFQLGETAHRLLFANARQEPEAVRVAKAFISANLAHDMTLEQVAAHAHVSPFHFCKIFKRATGVTFTDYVTRARVEKARRLLMHPSARITEIAYDVGFQSLSHFNRSFRRINSESPTEFRSRLRSTRSVPMAAAA
jgi:AraC-like DNA-binding protein